MPASSSKTTQSEKYEKIRKSEKAQKTNKAQKNTKPVAKSIVKNQDGVAEARLIAVYQLVSAGNTRQALINAQALASDYPNFQLAQLVYGDLLMNRVRPIKTLGDVPTDLATAGSANLQALLAESRLRTTAVKERPHPDAIPSQFLSLSTQNKHAIAVDVSRARLYLFENSRNGLKLLADYYISVGKAGTGKLIEGDLRTPLGLYFITSNLDPKTLEDLYGAGALPVNYPNALDVRRGKTGGGIWLHGTPSAQFTRAPLATEGCVAVSNPDLERIIRTVEIRTTPFLIAKNLSWVMPQSVDVDKKAFADILQAWAKSKSEMEPMHVRRFYAADFTADEKTRASHAARMRADAQQKLRNIQLNDVSFMRWTDESEFMVATFGVVQADVKRGKTLRQYWQRQSGQWKIIYEGVVG